MIQENLPSVLAGNDKQSGLAMYRALMQIKRLLEQADGLDSDELQASIDDIEIMITRIS
jgi:hypothetical protein